MIPARVPCADAGPPPLAMASRLTILTVDDDPLVRRTIVQLLQHEGLETVGDGDEAMSAGLDSIRELAADCGIDLS